MTLNTNDVRNEYTASAAQTVFNYTFKIYEDTDLNVYVTPSGQECSGSDLTTAYTVVGAGLEGGGSITLTTPTTSGDLVTIVSDIPVNRTTDYQNNGDFRPDTVNDDFDRTVSLVKQIEDRAGRSLAFPECLQAASSLSLPAPDSERFLRWKNDLSGLENTDPPAAVVTNTDTVSVRDYTSLKALSRQTSDQVVSLAYRSSEDDGGGGQFRWDSSNSSSSVTLDPGEGIYVPPDSDPTGAGGCWVRQYEGLASAAWFGVVFDGSTDNYTALSGALTTASHVELIGGSASCLIGTPLVMGDDQTLKLSSGAVLEGTSTPVVRMGGSNSSLFGDTKECELYCSGAATAGVLRVGHADSTDDTEIQYNTVHTLTLNGDDPYGLSTNDTIGIYGYSAKNWGTAVGFTYNNTIYNVFIKDVNIGQLLTNDYNANIHDMLQFWRMGNAAILAVGPNDTDGYGTKFGINFDDPAQNNFSCAENIWGTVFIDTSGQVGNVCTTLQLKFDVTYPNFYGILSEAGPNSIGYDIDSTVIGGNIYGQFNNVGGVGTNNSQTTLIAQSGGMVGNQFEMYQLVLRDGLVGTPSLARRSDLDTGMYFPGTNQVALVSNGAERVACNSTGEVNIGSTVGFTAGVHKITTHDVRLDNDKAIQFGGGNNYIQGSESGDFQVFFVNSSEVMRLTTSAVRPGTDNTYSSGAASQRWSVVYAATGTINTSDEREKDFEEVSEAERRAAVRAKKALSKFRWKSGGGLNFGIGAQTLEAIFVDEGLNPRDYEMLSFEDDRYGVRYDQLMAFILLAI